MLRFAVTTGKFTYNYTDSFISEKNNPNINMMNSNLIPNILVLALRASRNLQLVSQGCSKVNPISFASRNFASFRTQTTLLSSPSISSQCTPIRNSLLLQALLPNTPVLMQQPARSVTKFSLRKGKRKAVKAVIKRFKRLHWGAWIRTRCGRHKKMWKKSAALTKRLRQHVFVNGQQSMLLDKMVTKFWRRPKYYLDDPYTPYHTRNEFKLTKTKRM